MQPNNGGFFGLRLSQVGIPLNLASPSQLLYENNLQTETWRNDKGDLSLRLGVINNNAYGMNVYNSKGDVSLTLGQLGNSSYGMSVPASNGTIYFGLLSDGNLGIQVQDTTGYVLFEMTGQTWFWYDKATSTNVMQVGLLPDGTYGWAVAASGYNVSDGF